MFDKSNYPAPPELPFIKLTSLKEQIYKLNEYIIYWGEEEKKSLTYSQIFRLLDYVQKNNLKARSSIIINYKNFGRIYNRIEFEVTFEPRYIKSNYICQIPVDCAESITDTLFIIDYIYNQIGFKDFRESVKLLKSMISPLFLKRKELYDKKISTGKTYYYESERCKTYIMYDRNSERYKIGRSKHPEKRYKSLKSSNPDIQMVHVIDADIEKELHLQYKDKRVTGEWFKLDDLDIQKIITG